MKYVAIFHANLNYAFLEPHKYEQVIRASYETIFDVFKEKCPDAKYVFEASGFTIDVMAKETPDVLEKLKDAINRGQCEFMGAPYSHPIMANVPREDGYWSNYFAMQTYEKHLGLKPVSAWNPECTWMQYVPQAFRDAGYKYLTLDFESYMNCNDKDYSWVERNRTHDMNWGGNLPWYDLDPDCKFLHQPFKNIVPGLGGFCRSDRVVGKYVGYFLGKVSLEEYIKAVKQWTGKKKKGATVIIADDAEYTGTSGYYFVKYFRDYSKSFMVDEGAAEKLEKLIKAVQEIGEFCTFEEACEMEAVEEPFYVEDRYAWHRTYADAWAGTPEAKSWDPILSDLRKDYKENYQPILESDPKYRELVEKFWFHMTNSANSDGRWPPPPANTCPFNREWVLNEIEQTKKVLAEIKDTLRGIPLPVKQEEEKAPAWEYGFEFTEKDPFDVKNLNLYELSHGIYYGYRMYDEGEGEIREKGMELVNSIYEEFERRGFTGIKKKRLK